MRLIIKIIAFIIILFNPFCSEEVTAQIKDDYHSFNGVMYIPIIVNHQEELNFKDGTKKEKSIPEKKLTIQVNMNTKNMQVKNGIFSGIIVRDMGSTRDELVTFKGKVSKDQQKLEYIEITNNVTVYRLDTREDIEKTISMVARFENIPRSPYGSGYKYKYGISKIASVEYLVNYTIPRSHYVQNYTESFVKINEEQMGNYYSGVRADFKQGELKLNLKDDIKISVIPEEKEMLAVAVHALIISELLKIPDLKVLEGFKIGKLIDEIKLSQTGLVSEETIIRKDRIMTPDVEILLLAEQRVPVDFNLRIEKVTLRSKIRIVKSGKVYDPSLTFYFDLKQIKKEKNFIERIDAYIEKVIMYASHYLYE